MGNSWHERFGAEEYVYGEEPNLFIKNQASRLQESSKLVAFAEGEGRNAVYLARQGHEVTAYDYAQNGFKENRGAGEPV